MVQNHKASLIPSTHTMTRYKAQRELHELTRSESGAGLAQTILGREIEAARAPYVKTQSNQSGVPQIKKSPQYTIALLTPFPGEKTIDVAQTANRH